MSYDGWIEYNGVEIINLSRTAQLAEALGITTVWTRPSSVAWIEAELGGSDYGDITETPWYDPNYPASTEFAGAVPTSISGLGDSTRESVISEYTTDGGNSGKPRNATLPLVFNVVLVATTDRGAEFGKRWLDRRLSATDSGLFCVGSDLRYFRTQGAGAEIVHYRDVKITRGSSVTRVRRSACSTSATVTFTMTANDPYVYGAERSMFTGMGAAAWAPPAPVLSRGTENLTYSSCPVWDYTPIYDPLYPALVPSPTAPNLLPDGWNIEDGMSFQRRWARISPAEPSDLIVVPTVRLSSATEARRIIVSIWDNSAPTTGQCNPLWSAVVTYLPPGMGFYLDGERKAAYVWDGLSAAVRRADTLVFSPDAGPMKWAGFESGVGLMVTLDVFGGVGDVRANLSLTPKSD